MYGQSTNYSMPYNLRILLVLGTFFHQKVVPKLPEEKGSEMLRRYGYGLKWREVGKRTRQINQGEGLGEGGTGERKRESQFINDRVVTLGHLGDS